MGKTEMNIDFYVFITAFAAVAIIFIVDEIIIFKNRKSYRENEKPKSKIGFGVTRPRNSNLFAMYILVMVVVTVYFFVRPF